jgi:hypothetical protein
MAAVCALRDLLSVQHSFIQPISRLVVLSRCYHHPLLGCALCFEFSALFSDEFVQHPGWQLALLLFAGYGGCLLACFNVVSSCTGMVAQVRTRSDPNDNQ